MTNKFSHLRNYLDNFFKKVTNFRHCYYTVISFVVKNITKRPIVFIDWAGNRYWQYPRDEILFNLTHRTVSDAINITNFINRIDLKGWRCVDVGACIGATSIPMWKKVGPGGRVYSIEADHANINILKSNLRLNGFSTRCVSNYAICGKNGYSSLHITEGKNGWQSLGNPKKDKDILLSGAKITKKRVVTIKLDSFCKNEGINKIDLLKVDVEGAEIDVFRGGQKLLKNRDVNLIIFEISPKMLKWYKNRKDSDSIRFVGRYGYHLFRIEEDGRVRKLTDMNWTGGWGDCLAIAPGSLNLIDNLIIRGSST